MKLYPTFIKLPLLALLSLGLACSPLVVSADDGNRGRHGHHQQDHGKSHHRADHRKDYRDYGNHKKHGYRKGYKHGYKSGHHYYRPQVHHVHYVDVQRHYRDEHYYDRPSFFVGLYSDNLDVLYRD